MLHQTDDLRIVETKELIAPQDLIGQVPVTDQASTTVFTARQGIHDILGHALLLGYHLIRRAAQWKAALILIQQAFLQRCQFSRRIKKHKPAGLRRAFRQLSVFYNHGYSPVRCALAVKNIPLGFSAASCAMR